MVKIKDGLIAPSAEPPKFDIVKQTAIFQSGAKWFYGIAVLSLVNTAMSLTQSNIRFPVGMGITQVIDAFALIGSQETPTVSMILKTLSVILNSIFAGIIALFGWLALKKKPWAFIIGMIIFSLDSVLSLLFKDWISLGFHVLALICICKGFIALKNINKVAVSQSENL